MNIGYMDNDDIVWLYDPKEYFTIGSLYIKLCEGSNCLDFPGKVLYKSEILVRAFFSVWATTKGAVIGNKLKTYVLRRKNWSTTFLFIVYRSLHFGV